MKEITRKIDIVLVTTLKEKFEIRDALRILNKYGVGDEQLERAVTAEILKKQRETIVVM